MAEAKNAPTITDVLWAFTKLNMWPGSQKLAQKLMKQFKTVDALNAYVTKNYHAARTLHSTPPWVVQMMRPELGNKAAFLGSDPGMAKILLQAGAEGWDAAKTQARLEANPWWSSHNQQQKQWIIAGEADKNVIRNQSAQSLADEWLKLYGEQKDPSAFMKGIDGVASGAQSLDQWRAQQMRSQQFKDRYPGLAARQAAGLSAISPEQYRSLEENYKQTMQSFGVDASQFDRPNDYTNLFKNDIDPNEFGQRLQVWRYLDRNAGQRTTQAFAQHAGLAGLTTTDLYGLVSGQRPDLAQHYKNATGHPDVAPSFADIQDSLKQAEAENKALFTDQGAPKTLQTTQEQSFA